MGPAPTVDTEIISCAIWRGDEGKRSSSRSAIEGDIRLDSLGGSNGE